MRWWYCIIVNPDIPDVKAELAWADTALSAAAAIEHSLEPGWARYSQPQDITAHMEAVEAERTEERKCKAADQLADLVGDEIEAVRCMMRD